MSAYFLLLFIMVIFTREKHYILLLENIVTPAFLFFYFSCDEGSEMSSDDRSWLMRSVMSMDQAASVPYFYPRLFPLVRTANRWWSRFRFWQRVISLICVPRFFFACVHCVSHVFSPHLD